MHTLIETPLFTRLVSEYLTDEEYAALQGALAANPESGALIRGSGGLRKLPIAQEIDDGESKA